MAFPNYYPNYYNVMNPFYQPAQNQQAPQIQHSGFVVVQSEAEAKAYPVAPGNSVTFNEQGDIYARGDSGGSADR